MYCCVAQTLRVPLGLWVTAGTAIGSGVTAALLMWHFDVRFW
jgi:hypothetical protein